MTRKSESDNDWWSQRFKKKPKRFICQESDRLRTYTTFEGVRESSRRRKYKQGEGNLLHEQRDDGKLRTKRNGTHTMDAPTVKPRICFLALQLIFWTFTSGKMDATHQINISQHRRVIIILYADIGQKGSISADAKSIFVCDNDTCLIYSVNTDWRTALFFNIRKQK